MSELSGRTETKRGRVAITVCALAAALSCSAVAPAGSAGAATGQKPRIGPAGVRFYRPPARLPAAQHYPQTLTRCAGDLNGGGSFGRLLLDQLLKPSANLSPVMAALARNDPGRLRIEGPVLLEQGLADATVFPQFDLALSQSLIGAGDSVAYHTYPGATHATVIAAATSDATAFLKQRFGR